jgi:hypothetical protein
MFAPQVLFVAASKSTALNYPNARRLATAVLLLAGLAGIVLSTPREASATSCYQCLSRFISLNAINSDLPREPTDAADDVDLVGRSLVGAVEGVV